MENRLLPPGLHSSSELSVGDRIETDAVEVTAALIERFADLAGDRHLIHLDATEAARAGFPRRVAHGLLVLSLIEGLKSRAPARIDAYASGGWSVTFRRPVLLGDRIRAQFTVTRLRPAPGGQTLIELAMEALNQHEEVVQRGTTRLIARP
ncbi:MaoC family dehydratase [Tabrizicola sp. J26]|uniref:MaoC family dehydratase n=1 Tax=Alitabrizicola rongguiensis TaxID=2909234 RepID=UPI001F1E0084|nr:MaoC family dehydratase [Tabrizicola rongguiensis]MCF1710857.1 MaoC family dehydratase [Tabrizicola rongguiensis]